MKKWANVCKHIVMHYNAGWANGFYYNIKNWEVWNEPEKYEGDELRRQIYRLDFFHKFIEFVAENKLHLISLHGTPMKVFLFLLCLQNT